MEVQFRQDLQITTRQQEFEAVWVVKDPVSFSHFLFSEQEYFLAQLLDGKRSIEEVTSSWCDRFKSSSLSLEQVQQFVRRLIGDNLVVVDRMGYGKSLAVSNRSASRQSRFGWIANPLAIRFRGIDPSPILDQIGWIGRFVFHPATVALLMLSSLATLLFMLGNFESVASRIPAIEHLLSKQGVIGLIATLAIVKVLHELGHAVACRQFGGECFEIGVMLLALIPTLYCNVTDAWTIRERWKRMMVSFAGMYVEICLAALAAIMWFMTPPGLLNAMLFNVVLLCSVSTLLVNGNPLLRYDGYYLLSDWLDRPNLSQAAGDELKKFNRGLVEQQTRMFDVNIWLLVYALMSFLYRWFVIGVILYGVCALATRWGATEIGLGVSGMLLASLLIGRIRMGRRKSDQASIGSISWLRSSVALLVGGTLLAVILLLPLPHGVYGEFEVGLSKPVPVFAPSDGRLVSLVKTYKSVEAGDEVAHIENRELQQKVAQQRLELKRAQNELEQLSSRVNEAPMMASRIEVAKKNVWASEERFESFEQELTRMTVLAPVTGIVFPAADRILPGIGNTDVWQGGLADQRNQDCPVQSSEHLLTVGNQAEKQGVMFLNETDIGFVAKGQPVRLVFDRVPGRRLEGVVDEIFEEDQETDSGVANQKSYRIIVKLPDFPSAAVVGSIGRGRISVPNQTIATRMTWILKRAINTRL